MATSTPAAVRGPLGQRASRKDKAQWLKVDESVVVDYDVSNHPSERSSLSNLLQKGLELIIDPSLYQRAWSQTSSDTKKEFYAAVEAYEKDLKTKISDWPGVEGDTWKQVWVPAVFTGLQIREYKKNQSKKVSQQHLGNESQLLPGIKSLYNYTP